MENSSKKNPSNVRVPKKVKPKASALRAPEEKAPAKPIGRPKELGTKVQELKNRLLNSEESSRIVAKVISKALNDDDKDQVVCLKMCLDRILPVSMFEKAKDQRNAIQINITGLTDLTTEVKGADVEDATIVEVDDEA